MNSGMNLLIIVLFLFHFAGDAEGVADRGG